VNGANDIAALHAHQLDVSQDAQLHYWTLGAQHTPDGQPRPALILLHGMRDVGRCLLPVATALADRYYCVMPDLRGHGKSFKPGSYAAQHFLLDLRRLHRSLKLDRVSLLGHSLGGHIACRYAGIYNSAIDALVVVEGLGPPRWEMPGHGSTLEITRMADTIDAALVTARHAVNPRFLPDVAEASRRLVKNNPGLDAQWAITLARWGTEPGPDNTIQWAFDPRVQEVFLGLSDKRNFDFWRAVKARTLIVMGDAGHAYWSGRFPASGYSGRFSDAELNERLDAFAEQNQPAEFVEISGAGHQVHYDQPAALASAVSQFLQPSPPSSKHSENT